MAARVLELQYPGSQEMPHADAILVLADVTGKAYPPQPVVHLGPGRDRLVYATELYKKGDALESLSVSTAALHELWRLLGYRLAGWI